jgi:hypothetical protein
MRTEQVQGGKATVCVISAIHVTYFYVASVKWAGY